jgi:hypothetical protein
VGLEIFDFTADETIVELAERSGVDHQADVLETGRVWPWGRTDDFRVLSYSAWRVWLN